MIETTRDGSSSTPDIVRKVRDCLAEAWEHDKDNRKEAVTDLEFLAGKQWSDTDLQLRANRPALTINRLPQFVRQVTNDIRQADIAIKVVPSDGAVARAEQVMDPQSPEMGHNGGPPMDGMQQPASNKKKTTMADVYNGLIREIQYQSSAAHAYATAAEHQTACGIGYFRFITQYASDDTFDQEIRIKPIPRPMNVYCDPAAVEVDRSDARWWVVTEMMTRSEFKEKYPKAAEVNVETFEENTSGLHWSFGETVRVAEFWIKQPIKKTIAQLETGEVVELPKGIDESMLPIVEKRTVESHKIMQYVVSGAEVLEEPTEWAGKYFPIFPVIGSEIPLEDKTVRYGLIRFARDPQKLYNYARTSAAESMGQAPKSPWLVTAAMIKPFKSIWDTANKTLHPYLPYAADPEAPGAMPRREPPPDVPMAYVQEAGVADGDIKATVGMYDPQLGQRSNENSGRAILAREKQGDTGTFHYSDNLRRSLEFAGRALIDLIPRIYDNERVIRILGDDESEMYLPVNKMVGYDEEGEPVYINDLTVGKYDCRVKIGPSYATKRMESAESMMQFIQAVPNAAGIASDLIAKNMDWPGSEAIAERLKRSIPPEILGEEAPQQPPDPMQEQQAEMAQQMMQAQLAELQAKIEKLAADADKVRADTEKSEAEAHKTYLEAEMLPHQHEAENDRWHIEHEQREYEAEMSRAQRLQEFSMRNQGANGASRPSGESN